MRAIGFKGPIVGVSGGDETSLKDFLSAGADGALQKPAKTAEMIGLLMTGLQNYAATELDWMGSAEGSEADGVDGRREHCVRLNDFLDQCQVK